MKRKREKIAASAIIHKTVFYPYDILCIQCTFFYTSVWSLRLMLVSDIVVLTLDRDLSGFYAYFACYQLHFLSAGCKAFLFFLCGGNWESVKEEMYPIFVLQRWLVFRKVFPPSVHCWSCPVHMSGGMAVKTKPRPRPWYTFGLECISQDVSAFLCTHCSQNVLMAEAPERSDSYRDSATSEWEIAVISATCLSSSSHQLAHFKLKLGMAWKGD